MFALERKWFRHLMNIKVLKDSNVSQSVWASCISLTSLMSNSDLKDPLPSYLQQRQGFTQMSPYVTHCMFVIMNMAVRRIRVPDRLSNSK